MIQTTAIDLNAMRGEMIGKLYETSDPVLLTKISKIIDLTSVAMHASRDIQCAIKTNDIVGVVPALAFLTSIKKFRKNY